MKAVKVEFSRVFNNPAGYSNTKIGIVLELEKGEKANDVFQIAKEWVDNKNPYAENAFNVRKQEYEKALRIVQTPDTQMYSRVVAAQATVDEYHKNPPTETDYCPF